MRDGRLRSITRISLNRLLFIDSGLTIPGFTAQPPFKIFQINYNVNIYIFFDFYVMDLSNI